jgi:hypothetical protein
MAQELTPGTKRSLESSLQQQRFRITDNKTGQSIVVGGYGEGPTPAEQEAIFTDVLGQGRFTRGDLPAAAGGITSILGGLTRTASPWLPIATGIGGMVGEVAKQIQTPSQSGRWDILNIEEPALLGATTVDYDPSSPLSRAKMVATRGAEEAGVDTLGNILNFLPRKAAEVLQSFSLSGSPGLQAAKAQDPNLMLRSLQERPPVAPQSMPAGRKWLPTDPLVTGRGAGSEARNIFGDLTENAGRAKIRENMAEMDLLLGQLNADDVPLQGTEIGSIFKDILNANPGVPGMDRLQDYLQMADDLKGHRLQALPDPMVTQVRAAQDAQELGGQWASEIDTFWDRYITNPDATGPYADLLKAPRPVDVQGAHVMLDRDPGLSAAGNISLRQAINDKRYLEGTLLKPLYDAMAAGRGGPAVTRTTAIFKALRDVLAKRIDDTLILGAQTNRMPQDAKAAYDQINRRTQELHRMFTLVKESPAGYPGFSTALAPLASLSARGLEKATRFPLPAQAARAYGIAETDRGMPTEEEIARMAPTRENAARLAMAQPDAEQPSWLMEMIRSLTEDAANRGPTMASVMRRGSQRAEPAWVGPQQGRSLTMTPGALMRSLP